MIEVKNMGLALIHSGVFVDLGKLHTGIYETRHPPLYRENETIENIIRRCEKTIGASEYFKENIRLCHLVPAFYHFHTIDT